MVASSRSLLHRSHTTNLYAYFPSLRPHQMQSSNGKLLQCGHKYDVATPPCPPAGAAGILYCLPWFLGLCPASLPPPSPPPRRLLLFCQKGHSVAFSSFLKVHSYVFFPVPSFQRKEGLFHHSMSTNSIIAELNLLQVLCGWFDSCCHWPLYSCLPFFLEHPFETFFTLNLSHQ